MNLIREHNSQVYQGQPMIKVYGALKANRSINNANIIDCEKNADSTIYAYSTNISIDNSTIVSQARIAVSAYNSYKENGGKIILRYQ